MTITTSNTWLTLLIAHGASGALSWRFLVYGQYANEPLSTHGVSGAVPWQFLVFDQYANVPFRIIQGPWGAWGGAVAIFSIGSVRKCTIQDHSGPMGAGLAGLGLGGGADTVLRPAGSFGQRCCGSVAGTTVCTYSGSTI